VSVYTEICSQVGDGLAKIRLTNITIYNNTMYLKSRDGEADWAQARINPILSSLTGLAQHNHLSFRPAQLDNF
jgi:hypothetical protein